jgi:SAM-dependent methyltransferase
MTAITETHDVNRLDAGDSVLDPRLLQTRKAFDALSRTYDHSEETNELLLRLRTQTWDLLTDVFLPDSRLLDLGCGTGIDAVYLAERGCRVVATDLSPAMVERTRDRAAKAGVSQCIDARTLAIEDLTVDEAELSALKAEHFDGIYSNRGPLNCVDDLDAVAQACASLLPASGTFVATVIGRICPWEVLYYALRGRWSRARLRRRREFVAIPLQGQTIPTRYFTPREFYRAFSPYFALTYYRGLGIFLPPTYLAPLCRRFPGPSAAAAWLDDALGGLPGFRNAGDMFLVVLTRRGSRHA